MLYSLAIPFGYITGMFRLMSAKPLMKYVAFGFALDIIFTIALLFFVRFKQCSADLILVIWSAI